MVVDEAQLVQRARAGDTGAFEALVLAHQRFVYNLALRAVGSPADAEDIAQEAFLRAWSGLARFEARALFRTWLYRIVVNLCYNRLPRLRQELAALPVEDTEDVQAGRWDGLPDPQAEDPASRTEAEERKAFIQHQVNRLPEGYRLMVLLRFQKDCSYEEIAEVMGMPLGTVKTGLFRTRQQLREALRQHEEVSR